MSETSRLTERIMSEWDNPYGWAPNSAAKKIYDAMKPWVIQLTDCLAIWSEKGLKMTNGELILANTNLGSLVESWLKFFYCVFYEDYLRNPKTKRDGTIIEPNDMSFENLKIYSRGILWEQGDKWDKWVELMQHRRNAIHAFNFREIGTNADFISNLDEYHDFIELIITRLPDSPESMREYY